MKLLSKDELLAIFPVHEVTLFRWSRNPRVGFPAPIRIGQRCFWPAAEVDSFLERSLARRATSRPAASPNRSTETRQADRRAAAGRGEA